MTATSIVVRACPADTVTVVAPGAFAVNTPAVSTVATSSFDDCQWIRTPSARPPPSARALRVEHDAVAYLERSLGGSTRMSATRGAASLRGRTPRAETAAGSPARDCAVP